MAAGLYIALYCNIVNNCVYFVWQVNILLLHDRNALCQYLTEELGQRFVLSWRGLIRRWVSSRRLWDHCTEAQCRPQVADHLYTPVSHHSNTRYQLRTAISWITEMTDGPMYRGVGTGPADPAAAGPTSTKISKIGATRCQILRPKCTKLDFSWCSTALTQNP